jgi:hypothetical protein
MACLKRLSLTGLVTGLTARLSTTCTVLYVNGEHNFTKELCLLTARATRPRKSRTSQAYVPTKPHRDLIGTNQGPSVVNWDRARRRRRLTSLGAGFVSKFCDL